MKNFNPKNLIWILLFGSLWGLSEAFVGGLLYSADIAQASVYLGAWALLLLAAARKMVNVPGTSVLIGSVAVLFRLVNTGFFICHLGGIFLLGAAFDLTASLIIRRKEEPRKSVFSQTMSLGRTGLLSAFLSNGSFALIFAFIIRYEYWLAGGWAKVLEHTFISGGLLSLAAAVCVPVGWTLGAKVLEFSSRNFSLAARYATALSVVFWIMGRLKG